MRNALLKNYEEIFNARGGDYDDAMHRYPRAREQEFENILRRAALKDGDIACDFPSGGGYISRYVSPRVKLHLVETSQAFYDLCRRNAPDRATHLTQGNILPFADGALDKIISLAGLHHIFDKPALFRDCTRALKPGGRLCVADAYAGAAPALFLDGFVDAHHRDGHKGEYFTAETPRQIETAGLRVISAERVSYPWVFDSCADMADFCKMLFSVDGVTQGMMMQGIEKHLGCREENGLVLMNWELYFITAEKL